MALGKKLELEDLWRYQEALRLPEAQRYVRKSLEYKTSLECR